MSSFEARSALLEIFPQEIVDQAITILSQSGAEVNQEGLVQLCLQIMEGGEVFPVDVQSRADTGEGLKMIFLIQASLKMSPGKVASQCVHAALGCSRSATLADMERWTGNGEKAVCLNVDSEEEMDTLTKRAKEYLNVHECFDAGRTEVDSGAKTVVAIGPHPESVIDQVTRHLKLY